MHAHFPIARLAMILPFVYFARGCVVYDIRNQLREANARLVTIDQSMQQVNQTLKTSDKSLASINKSMEPIQISLRRIDDELAGFRQTIEKVDKFVPGKIAPDAPPPAKQEPTNTTTPQPTK